MKKQTKWLLSTAAIAAGFTGAAQAQESTLPDVVITAERREASVQDTPLSIVALTAEQLQGVQGAQDLNELAPGLDIRNNGSAVSLYIRGVGAAPTNLLLDQANAFSVDQVFFSRGVGPDAVFYDLERVEVLKGPQGILYGRNATSGAVNVITRRPELGELGGSLGASVANYDAHSLSATLNVPVGEDFALRGSFNRVKRDGFFDDGYGDADTTAGRLRALWEPTERVSLLVSADYAMQQGQGPGYVPHGPTPSGPGTGNIATEWVGGDPWIGPCSAQLRAYVSSQTAGAADGAECDGFIDTEVWGVSAIVDVDLDFAQWTTIAAHRETSDAYRFYVRWDDVFSTGQSDQDSFETRLASSHGGPLQWIVGAFYNKEDLTQLVWAESAPGGPPFPYIRNDLESQNEAWAVFGSTTLSLTDTFRVSAGVRYTDEEKVGSGSFGFSGSEGGGYVTSNPIDNEVSFSATTYRVGVEFDVTPDSLLYANVSTGFHAGGIRQGTSEGPLPSTYQPEELTAYAIGSKNRFFDDRVQLNAEIFFWKYEDLQQTYVGLVNCGPACQTLSLVQDNVGEAEIKGIDIDGNWLITDNGLFTLSLLWTDSEYKDFTFTQFGTTFDARGNRIAGLGEWQGTVGYRHTFPLQSGAELMAGLRARYMGERELGALQQPGSHEDATLTGDFDLTYTPEGGNWRLTGFVNNFTDEESISSAGSGGIAEASTDAIFVTLNPPRTYGVRLAVDF